MRRAVLVLMMSATVLSVVSDARGWSGKRESNGIIDYGLFIASHLPLTRSTLPGHAVLVDKTKQKLFLYAREDAWREVLRFDCSTGENRGPKLKSGDGKTPEGVYFFTHAYDNRELSETYGTRAFPIDYPNLLDKFAGHTGNAIWLHGTNKPLKPRDSNGCIVLANVDIDRLAPYLKLNRTPIVIVGQLQASPHTRDSNAPDRVQSLLRTWTDALAGGSYHQYLAAYSDSFLPHVPWWSQWDRLRRDIESHGWKLTLRPDNPLIFRHGDIYTVLFDLQVRMAATERLVARHKFYIREENKELRIIGDEYQFIPGRGTEGAGKRRAPSQIPLLARTSCLKAALEVEGEARRARQAALKEEKRIIAAVDLWLAAWSSKDLKAYGSSYARDFRHKQMDLRAWLKYKDRLNRQYAYIRVNRSKLSIGPQAEITTVTFVQTYESDRFRAVGLKTLLLKKESGVWKIYREEWKKSQSHV
ncbi:MAG: L,D-transpeptidase family protein [Deltaproteobacteria bacterium]|nr:L,D-transpeptidase family protein [Deltaproteobacteria bacterium]